MSQNSFRQVFERTAAPLGVIGTVGGFIGDVLSPLGEFAPWVAGISAAIFIGTVLYFLLKRNDPQIAQSNLPALIFIAGGSTVIFGIWSAVFAQGPEQGYLAANIEPIAQIQASLLGLEEDVAEIKETTTETAENVETLATAQAEGFADIQTAFANLQAGQTIIPNPATPQEWYSNARLYQLKGDTANARTAYEGYFAFNLEYVDPYLEYLNILKAAEGIARTRQIVADLQTQQPNSLTLEMLAITLLDNPDERLTKLTTLSQRAADFAPVFYELGQEYSSQLRATFTQNLLDGQRLAFETLLNLENQQQAYSRFFIDKSLAQENLEQATVLMESYTAVQALNLSFLPFYTYEGLTIVVILPEGNVQDLRFSLDDPNPTNSTGKTGFGDFITPNTSIGPIPLQKGDHTLYVQYTDANGTDSEIFSHSYTIGDIVLNFQQQPFDFSANGIPVNFTAIITAPKDQYAFYTFHYSIDNDSLDQTLEGSALGTPITIVPVTTGDHVLYIQGEGEGEKTEVVTYNFTVQ